MRGDAKDRVLSHSELGALGKAMTTLDAKSPAAVAALRLITLTGMRREEAAAYVGPKSMLAAAVCVLNARRPAGPCDRLGPPHWRFCML